MRRIKTEKVSGIVALSYLVLIPAGAFLAWRKLQIIEKDVNYLWEQMDMPTTETTRSMDLSGIKTIRRLFTS